MALQRRPVRKWLGATHKPLGAVAGLSDVQPKQQAGQAVVICTCHCQVCGREFQTQWAESLQLCRCQGSQTHHCPTCHVPILRLVSSPSKPVLPTCRMWYVLVTTQTKTRTTSACSKAVHHAHELSTTDLSTTKLRQALRVLLLQHGMHTSEAIRNEQPKCQASFLSKPNKL